VEVLAPIATSNDDHVILHQIGRMVSARRGLLAPQNRDLLPTHPIERTADVERPDVVQRLQPVSAAKHPDFVLVEDSGVRAARRGNVRGREHQARPVAHQDVKDEDAVVV